MGVPACAGVFVGGGAGGGLDGLLKAELFIEIGPLPNSNSPIDVIVAGPPDPNFGEWVGNTVTIPVRFTAHAINGDGLTPGVVAPGYSGGALVIDPNQTFFSVVDTPNGGTNLLVVSPTGTTTPLTIPPNGFWIPAAPNDWAIQQQAGTDLAFDATGEIVSTASGIYAAMWQVAFSEVPTP